MLLRHVLRNALISTVTLFGLNDRHAARRRRHHRDRLRHPGRRAADDREHLRARLSGDPGADAGAGAPGLARLPADRHRPGVARSAGRSDEPSRRRRDPPRDHACRRPCRHPRRRRASILLAEPEPGRLRPASSRPTTRCASTTTPCCRPPSLAHLFGTDNFGRDVLSRVIWAYRIDMQIALFATVVPLIFGTHRSARWSATTAAGSRRCSAASVDAVVTFPFLVLVIAIVAVLGPGPAQHVHRRQRRRLGLLCPAACAAEIQVQRSSTMPPPARCMGYTDAADHLPPPPAQRHHARHRLLDDRHGARHPAGLEPRLSRPRRPAAGRRMGRADRRRQELHDHRLVDFRFPRHRHRPHRPRLQPARRRAGRPSADRADERRAGDHRSRSAACATSFATPRGTLTAVDGIDFDVAPARFWASSASPAPARASRCGRIMRLVRAAGPGRGRRSSGAAATCSRMRRAQLRGRARRRDRDDLPGADDGAEPGPARSACRSTRTSRRTPISAGGRAASGPSSCSNRSAFRPPAAGSTTIRTSSPAACASG